MKFENFSKTLLFEFFKLFHNPAILLINFKRTQRISIQANFSYFKKITNEWIVGEYKTFFRLRNASQPPIFKRS